MAAVSDKILGCNGEVENLTLGFLEIYEEPLKAVSKSLSELITKQTALIEMVSTQNEKLQNTQNSDGIKHLFTDIASCRERLTLIKRQMISLHERSNKLRSRSQSVLQKATGKRSARVQELEREQRLIGGPSKPQGSTRPT